MALAAAAVWLARSWALSVLASAAAQTSFAVQDVYLQRAQLEFCRANPGAAATLFRQVCAEAGAGAGDLVGGVLRRVGGSIEWCGPFPCRSVPQRDWALYFVILVLLLLVYLLSQFLLVQQRLKRVQRQVEGGALPKRG